MSSCRSKDLGRPRRARSAGRVRARTGRHRRSDRRAPDGRRRPRRVRRRTSRSLTPSAAASRDGSPSPSSRGDLDDPSRLGAQRVEMSAQHARDRSAARTASGSSPLRACAQHRDGEQRVAAGQLQQPIDVHRLVAARRCLAGDQLRRARRGRTGSTCRLERPARRAPDRRQLDQRGVAGDLGRPRDRARRADRPRRDATARGAAARSPRRPSTAHRRSTSTPNTTAVRTIAAHDSIEPQVRRRPPRSAHVERVGQRASANGSMRSQLIIGATTPHHRAVARRCPTTTVDQSGLADAGLAGDHHHRRTAARGRATPTAPSTRADGRSDQTPTCRDGDRRAA